MLKHIMIAATCLLTTAFAFALCWYAGDTIKETPVVIATVTVVLGGWLGAIAAVLQTHYGVFDD